MRALKALQRLVGGAALAHDTYPAEAAQRLLLSACPRFLSTSTDLKNVLKEKIPAEQARKNEAIMSVVACSLRLHQVLTHIDVRRNG